MPSSRHCLAALLCCGLLAAPAAADALWPRPRNVSLTGACVSIDASAFLFTAVGFDSATLETAFERYTAVLGALRPSVAPAPCAAPVGALPALLVNVTTPDETLSLATDESYELDVPAAAPAGATLTARSVYGALRGLETFAQLADWRADLRATVVAVGAVADAPAFAHRGALIDTSRHFLPLPSLLAMVDALGQNKFNVLHWHIVDSQSFPFVSRAFPALSERGAWGAGDAALVAAHTYKPADVQAVIARGRSWGIRVVPEFDTPGHSLVWGQGQPGLLTACYNATTGLPDGTYGPIDPTVETTWTFLTALFAEVADVFPDAYVHIGGDEVDFTCWASNPAVNAWMAANGIAKGDYVGLEAYYINRVMGIVKATGRSYVGYEELFDNGCKLDADAVINVWKYHNTDEPPFDSEKNVVDVGPRSRRTRAGAVTRWEQEVFNVTRAGFKTIVSSPWYINYIGYGVDWPQYYIADLRNFGGTPEQVALVLGGEVCIWGEFVDATNLDARFWPRASTVGEALWFDPGNAANLTDAAARLQAHACRLMARGISAEPPNGPSYCPVEWATAYAPPWAGRARADL